MDVLMAMRVADEVGRLGSFTAAGQALKLSTPSVSRLISELEAELGVRLFNRTTRRVSPTEAGHAFLRRSADILDHVESLIDETRALHRTPQGTLRVSCVHAFGTDQLAPAIPAFLERYPGISIELDISNRKVDLVNEHFDVAIRVGDDGEGLHESSYIARQISSQKLIFVAAPEYLNECGEPASLDDLSRHRTIKQVSGTWGMVHRLRRGNKTIEYRFPDMYVLNSLVAEHKALLTGYGCGLIPDYLVAADIAAGRLVRILPDYETTKQSIFAVFAHRTYVATKIRAFVDYLVEIFNRDVDDSGIR